MRLVVTEFVSLDGVYQAPGGSFRYVVVGFEPHTG